jgi:hypothetical protein
VKGILFNTDMVRAILDGRKTQTRRLIKDVILQEMSKSGELNDGLNRPPYKLPDNFKIWHKKGYIYPEWGYRIQIAVDDYHIVPLIPQYQAGDILYVREAWSVLDDLPYDNFVYRANYGTTEDDSFPPSMFKWRPSIHMPKEASRIFLRVTDVQVERVQDITEADAMAEGIHDDYPMDKVYCSKCKGEGLLGTHDPITLGHMDIDCHYCDTAKKRFVNFWDSLYAAKGYDWDVNPWVWKYTFERCEKP